MALDIQEAEYFNFTINGNAGEEFRVLSNIAESGVNLLAFKAVPIENSQIRFSLFPDDSQKLKEGAKKAQLDPDGPHPGLIIKGYSDDSGSLAEIFNTLSGAGINGYESSGIANLKDSYGVVLYLKREDCKKALAVLK